jgi:hypothetical protein
MKWCARRSMKPPMFCWLAKVALARKIAVILHRTALFCGCITRGLPVARCKARGKCSRYDLLRTVFSCLLTRGFFEVAKIALACSASASAA